MYEQHVVDEFRDHRCNAAADFAERSQNYVLARWLRRHASPYVRAAVRRLFPEAAVERIHFRTALWRQYRQAVRAWHPDGRPEDPEAKARWHGLRC